MATAETLTTSDGQISVVVTMTDGEVCHILRTRKAGNEFAKGLLEQFATHGCWTQNQRAWAHKLADEATGPQPPRRMVDLGDFRQIAEMFERAAAKLKYPKIVFDFSDQPITLYRASSRSKHPGSIQVTNGGSFSAGVYYGRIDTEGQFHPGRDCTPDVTKFLKLFAADPAGVASEYGKKLGQCCFCSTRLTDKRSVAVGFGPTCARNYHLEKQWREALAKDKESQ